MPMIDLFHPENAFTPERRAALTEELTSLLLEMEGAVDNAASRAISWMFLHPMAAGTICLAGKPSPMPLYRVIFSVPQGTRKLHGPLSHPQRERLFDRATAAILRAEGSADTMPNRFRVWCFLNEIPEGTWGGLGMLVGMRDISAFVRPDEGATPVAEKARDVLKAFVGG